MAEKNRVRFDKLVWDNFPPFFFIFIVVLVVFLGVGLVTKAVSIGLEFPSGKLDGGVLVPLIILVAWFFFFSVSIVISLWKGGRSKGRGDAGQQQSADMCFPGGGACSQW